MGCRADIYFDWYRFQVMVLLQLMVRWYLFVNMDLLCENIQSNSLYCYLLLRILSSYMYDLHVVFPAYIHVQPKAHPAIFSL